MRYGQHVRIKPDATSIRETYRGRECMFLTEHPRLEGHSMLCDRPPGDYRFAAQILVADRDFEAVDA